MDREIRPWAAEADMNGSEPSDEIFRKMGDAGLLAARLGPGDHLKVG